MNMKTLGTRCACALAFVVIALGSSTLKAQPQANEYLQDDGKIFGNQINYFPDKGMMIAVVRGDFRFQVGSRTVSGDNAVIWISTHGKTQLARHDVTIYVSGNAKVEDVDSCTTDKMMLVRLHLQGRITANGNVSSKPLRNSPLYRSAIKTLREDQQMFSTVEKRAAERGQPVKEDAVVVRQTAEKAAAEKKETAEESKPGQPETQADDSAVVWTPDKTPAKSKGEKTEAVTPAAPETAAEEGKEKSGTDEAIASARAAKKADSQNVSDAMASLTGDKKKNADEKPTELAAVNFDAADGVEMQKDAQNPDKRIIISKGPIYISQGPAKSLSHVELRAQSAVVFAQQNVVGQDKDEKVPYAPELIGPGTNQGTQVTGAYLEGDVVIARGERTIMGKAAYYDFVTQKAIILKPIFRTVQEQRNIPIYIRADEAHVLGPKETEFKNAIVSTCDFHTPSYSLNSKRVRFKDETAYDDDGTKLSENAYSADYDTSSFNINGVPIFFLPPGKSDFEQGHTALRNIAVGQEGDLGVGVQSEWHLFRLLGIPKPSWFDATLTISAYKEAVILGSDYDYEKQEGNRSFSGYGKVYGMIDNRSTDVFGRDNQQEIDSKERGRVLLRHKEYLPRDWEIQAELSLLSDRNYLREFFEDEYFTGKENENLIYAKKQRDNWAVTALLKARLNYFQSQTESLPDVSAFLIGQPLFDDLLTYFGEARMGVKRLEVNASDTLAAAGSGMDNVDYREKFNTNTYARFDNRNELTLPFQIDTPSGPINVAPFVVGRLTVWGPQNSEGKWGISSRDMGTRWMYSGEMGPSDNTKVRPYGSVGVRSNMNFWRVYNSVQSRLFDVNRLRHIITPEVVFFTSTTGGVSPTEVYPLDQDIENNIIQQQTGVKLAVMQRLQTKRGAPGNERTVDWMRLNVEAGIFDGTGWLQNELYPGDGRFFFDRPENSLAQNYLGAEYTWNISDRTVFTADGKYDFDRGELDILNFGFAVQRDPRLTYYLGFRYQQILDAAVGTVGFDYQISKKYMIKVFEQYDFKYRDGMNLGTSVMLVRRLPRWNVGINFTYDACEEGQDALTMMIMLWPEGVPEARLGGGKYNLLSRSSEN